VLSHRRPLIPRAVYRVHRRFIDHHTGVLSSQRAAPSPGDSPCVDGARSMRLVCHTKYVSA
jgi:hypothetical protein